MNVLLAFTALATLNPTIMYVMDGALKTIVPGAAGLLAIIVTFIFSEHIAHRASHNAKNLYIVLAGISSLATYVLIWSVKLSAMPDDIAIGGLVAASVTIVSILILFRRDASAWLKGHNPETFR